MNALIGYTGFVGSNMLDLTNDNAKFEFYNSSNINSIQGREFEYIYISAIQAKKWWANQNTEEDKRLIDELFDHLKHVSAKKVVFISTVDVYQPPVNSDEDTTPTLDIHPYGANRLYAEEQIKSLFCSVNIVRLQGLVANNLSKNIVFDLKNKNMLENINPDSCLQWYPLSRLKSDIDVIIQHNLPLVNLSVEPVLTQSIIDIAPLSVEERDIVGTQATNQVRYDVTSKYADLFGGNNGYIVSAEESLEYIADYFKV